VTARRPRLLLFVLFVLFVAALFAGPRGARADEPPSPSTPDHRIAVTLAGADAAHVWSIDAVHRTLAVPVVIAASADGEAAEIGVQVDPATFSEASVVLKLADATDLTRPAQTSVALTMHPGEQRVLRLSGDGFDREGTYRAFLTIKGERAPTTYLLRVQSSPGLVLGLHATEWVQSVSAYPILHQNVVSTCIPIDASLQPLGTVHYVIEAPAQPRPDSERIAPADLRIAPNTDECPGKSIQLRFGPVPPGRYDGVLDIEGQKLPVQLTLRPPAFTVFVAVLFGALLSLIVRGIARYLRDRASNEQRIAHAEGRLPKRDVAWDGVRANNEIRRARGKNRLFLMDGIGDCLDAALEAPARPEVALVMRAMSAEPLPARLRRQLGQELDNLQRLSSASDADEAQRGIAALAAEASGRFRARMQAWLGALRDKHTTSARALDGVLAGDEPLAEAIAALDRLVADAELLFDRGVALDGELVGLLERVEPTLDELVMRGKTRAAGPLNLVDVTYCTLRADPAVVQATPIPISTKTEIARVHDAIPRPARALEEVTFEVRRVPPVSAARLRFQWRIGRDLINGGPRLTYVFAAPRRLLPAAIEVRLFPLVPGEELENERGERLQSLTVSCRQRIFAPSSILKSLRTSAWVAEQAAFLIGVTVASSVAALYWVNHAFGSWSDYINLLLAGVGVDAGTNNAALQGILARMAGAKRRKAKPPTESGGPHEEHEEAEAS
jgi:hypothetical protein